MTKYQAYEKMLIGEKVTHTLFSPSEYIYIEKLKIKDENGYDFTEGFEIRNTKEWDDGWSLFENNKEER